jgi:hypothetical protein
MPTKLTRTTMCLLLIGGLLSACGGGTVTPAPVPGIETVIAQTFETMTAQAASAVTPPPDSTPVPTLLPTVTPAQVYPAGTYGPYPDDLCRLLRTNFEQALSVPVTMEIVPFEDPMGGVGTACRIHVTGTGASLGMAGPMSTILTTLTGLGWTEDANYGAAGPQTVLGGFHSGAALGVLTVRWDPAAGVVCPPNQPVASCVMQPEQKLFDVTFDAAQIVVYVPLPADQCAAWQTALQPVLPVPLVTETVAFRDLTGDIGTACRLRAAGTGLDFANIVAPAQDMDGVLTSAGWTMNNGADGPTGTLRQYVKDNLIAVVTVRWSPSADANCPSDQPISACPLTPLQKQYTVTVDFAQK